MPPRTRPIAVAATALLLVVAAIVVAILTSRSHDSVAPSAPSEPGVAHREHEVDTTEPPVDANPRSKVESVSPEEPAAAVAPSVEGPRLVLHVRVVDSRARPIEGALFSLPRDPKVAAARSDAEGNVRLSVPCPYDGSTVGDGKVELDLGGEHLTTKRWYAQLDQSSGEQSLGDHVLNPAGRVVGRVVGVDGRAVEGAFVRAVEPFARTSPCDIEVARTFAHDLGALGNVSELRLKSGADGTFAIGGVRAGPVSIAATVPGSLTAISAPIEVLAGAIHDVGTLVIEPPSDAQRITGTVRDETGAPVRAQVRFAGRQRHELASRGTSADELGRFEIVVASGRDYDLSFSRGQDDRGGLVVEHVAAGTFDLDVRLATPRSIEVEARAPDGSLLSLMRVSLTTPSGFGIGNRSAPTERGTQTFTTPEGPFFVFAFVPGWRGVRQGPFDASTVPDLLVFQLEPATGIRGRVVAKGKPVPGARVHLHRALGAGEARISDDGFHASVDGPARGGAECDSEGTFMIQNVETSTWILHAEHPGFARAASAPLTSVDGTDVRCPDLELVEGGTLEGRVLVADGVEVKGTLVGVSGGDAHVATAKVGQDGTYRFEYLSPGPWQVRRCDPEGIERTLDGLFRNAGRDARVTWDAQIEAGKAIRFDLDLRHRIPSFVDGSLRLGDASLDAWHANLIVGMSYQSASLESDGGFRVSTPEPGDLDLNISASRFAFIRPTIHQRIHVAPGANSWSLVLETGSVLLEGLPTFRARENHGEPRYTLKWRGADGVTWRGAIMSSDDGTAIPIEDVPVGRISLVETRGEKVLLELDVVHGQRTTAKMP